MSVLYLIARLLSLSFEGDFKTVVLQAIIGQANKNIKAII